jgi:hypothetical protein
MALKHAGFPDENNKHIDSRFDENNIRFDNFNKRIDLRFFLLLGSMITITDVLLAAIKL